MKKLFVILIVICLIPPSCGKKKQRELEAKEALAKTERAEAFSHLKSKNIVAYITDYVFENKEKAIGTIPVVKIPRETPFVFVYKGKEHSFTLNKDLWGIKEGDHINVKEGYVKETRYFLVPAVIKTPQKFWTKEELLNPWLEKYPVTAVQYDKAEGKYKEDAHHPTFYNLETFKRTAVSGVKNIYLKDGPTLQARCGNIYLFFNSHYKPWGIRPEYKK
jgi:hypothetical protein